MLNSLSDKFAPRISRICTKFALHVENLCALRVLCGELRNTLLELSCGFGGGCSAKRAGGGRVRVHYFPFSTIFAGPPARATKTLSTPLISRSFFSTLVASVSGQM